MNCLLFCVCEGKWVCVCVGVTVEGSYDVVHCSHEALGERCMILAELAKEAGLCDGVVNIIHGQHDGEL